MLVDNHFGVKDNVPTFPANSSMQKINYKTPGETRRISFIAFPGVVLLDLTGPWEVFEIANKLSHQETPPYELQLISGNSAQQIQTGAGIVMESHQAAKNCRGAIDTLVVPAIEVAWNAETGSRESTVLRRLAKRSRRVVSICGGAFLLAEAGLLNGKKATTHWRAAKNLASRFPEIDVQPDSIYVKDGNFYTSAGVTAGIDLALALVEEDLGQTIALECARNLVVFMRRPGGQSQFSTVLESQHTERNVINELIAWAADHLSRDLSVEALAKRSNMSSRNFSRVFHNEVGQTPAVFIEKLRIDASRQLLEETDDSIALISENCGFGSADSFRRSFQRVLKVAPSDCRTRFR